MGNIFSDRISDVPKSFIREILKVTADKNIISFAGGLPNRKLFPVEELKKATIKLFNDGIDDALQYSTSEGDLKLREWIAKRYKEKQKITISPDNIIITSGSQQGLDIIGKTMINESDDIMIEEPGYLGAIQAFSLYRPSFHPVQLNSDGPDIAAFKKVFSSGKIKLCYTVPNFQNPSGITYTFETRKQIAEIIAGSKTFLIEDNPYGELRFKGEPIDSFYTMIPENTILLGSFSKTVVPSFRVGWIVAQGELHEKLLVAKQASDLHTNYFTQRVLTEYLSENDLDRHIEKIIASYGAQRDTMVESIRKYFPENVHFTEPEGGMFLWVTLPDTFSAAELFYLAIKENIAFVPGDPFYINKKDVNTFRLNYSCMDNETIEKGIKTLGAVIKKFVAK